MSSKILILVGALVFLLVGSFSALAAGELKFPESSAIALYCPRNIASNPAVTTSESTFPGPGITNSETSGLDAGRPIPRRRIDADPDVNLGTVGELTSLNFKTDSNITPYLGARFEATDLANSEMVVPKKVAQEDKTNPLPYRLGFGLGCAVDKNLNLNLGYRIALPTQLQLKDSFRQGLVPPDEGNEVSVGIKVKF